MVKDKSDSNVSVRELYTLIDNRMGQVNDSIYRLEGKFDSLESGRISNMEKDIANMQGRMMMIPTVISIAISVFFFIVNLLTKGIK